MSKIDDLKLFNAVVNPENLPIYYFKLFNKGDGIFGLFSDIKKDLLAEKWEDHQSLFGLSIDDLIKEMENGNKLNFSIFLEKTDYWYLDIDSDNAAILTDEFFKNRKHIKVESQKIGHYHYFFKVGKDIVPCDVDKLKVSIHDYYSYFSSFSPVLPGIHNYRNFARIDLDCDVLNMSDLL